MAALLEYKVTIHTGDKEFAGTDSTVYVTLTGAKGETGKQPLNQSNASEKRELFERDQHDEFTFKDKDIGGLKNIQ